MKTCTICGEKIYNNQHEECLPKYKVLPLGPGTFVDKFEIIYSESMHKAAEKYARKNKINNDGRSYTIGVEVELCSSRGCWSSRDRFVCGTKARYEVDVNTVTSYKSRQED